MKVLLVGEGGREHALGWKIAAIYLVTGLCIALFSGLVIGRLNLEKQVEPWVYEMRMDRAALPESALTWTERMDYGLQAVKDIVLKVWPYVLAGILAAPSSTGMCPRA